MAGVRHFLSTIRIRLILIAILAVLPVFAVTVYVGLEQRREAIDRAQERALSVARVAASDQERLLEGTRQLLMAISHFPAVQDYDSEECGKLLADLIAGNPAYSGLGAALPNGDVFCTAHYSSVKINCFDRPFFQRALETKDFVLGSYVTMRISGQPGIAAVYPALDDANEIRAVVYAGIDLTWLDGFIAQAELPEGSTLGVIDQAGTLLTRFPDPERWRGQSLPEHQTQLLLTQSEGLTEAAGLDGVQRIYAFARLSAPAEGNLFVRVGIPKTVALAGAQRIFNRYLLALLAATLLAFTLSGLEGHVAVLRPLNAIITAVKRLDAGDLSARVEHVPGNRELGALAAALDQMAATMESRENDLRRESARAEALVSIASRLNSDLDLDHVLEAVCQEAARALQVGSACVGLRDESGQILRIASQCGWQRCVTEPMQESWRAALSERLERGEPVFISDVPLLGGPQDGSNGEVASRAVLGAPMIHEDRFIGVIWVCMPGDTAAFAEDDAKFLRGISDLAARAVENARLYRSLGIAERRRAELVRGLISAQEDERRRIARDLHDDTSQSLSALIMGLDALRLALEAGEQKADGHVRNLRSVAETILENTRRLISDLRPSLLDDLGLLPAIAWYAEQRLGPLGVEVEFQCNSNEVRLPPAIELTLFRIAQEAITNTARHSGATSVKIGLDLLEADAILSVSDNGQGFRLSSRSNQTIGEKGVGLLGVQERVSTLGGEVQINTAPGYGTVLSARVPITEEVSDTVYSTRSTGR